MTFDRQEIEDAFQRYQDAAHEAGRTGDWTPWVNCFTEDCNYVEHMYGVFTGRQAVLEWITPVMTQWPFDHMQLFPWDWYTVDAEQGWVIGQVENRFIDPGDGEVYEAANWTPPALRGRRPVLRGGGRLQPRGLRARGQGVAGRLEGEPPVAAAAWVHAPVATSSGATSAPSKSASVLMRNRPSRDDASVIVACLAA